MLILPLKPTYNIPASDIRLDLTITTDVSRIKCHGQFQASGTKNPDVLDVKLNLELCVNTNFVFERDFEN